MVESGFFIEYACRDYVRVDFAVWISLLAWVILTLLFWEIIKKEP